MPRRIYTPVLKVGQVELSEGEAHHVRSVLRMEEGEAVELFDDAGNVAEGRLLWRGSAGAAADVRQVNSAARAGWRIVVASAVPKGERADWMVEKLSELGVWRFVPLQTARSVVHPSGRSKHQRWQRLAIESAKQSRRVGVMEIDDLTPLSDAIAAAGSRGWYLSTADRTMPAAQAVGDLEAGDVTLFIGPEGGWTEQEVQALALARLTPVGLTDTILRIETAAVAAASVVACRAAAERSK